jgi:hypothetical protein
MEFYASVERATRDRQVPEALVSRVDWREGGVLSAKREYLRVSRGRLVFDICGAPFGTGFFVSWWLVENTPSAFTVMLAAVALLLAAPFLFSLGLLVLTQLFGFFVGVFLLFLLSAASLLAGLFALGASLRAGAAWADPVYEIPFAGQFLRVLFQPATYYRIDTTLMFQQQVHAAVVEVVEEMTRAKGLRSLSEAERKPVMREFFGR